MKFNFLNIQQNIYNCIIHIKYSNKKNIFKYILEILLIFLNKKEIIKRENLIVLKILFFSCLFFKKISQS